MGKVATEATLLKATQLLSVIAGKGIEMSPMAFKQLVKSGEVSSWFDIGDQIVSTYQHGTTLLDNPWDITHIAANGDTYLKMHYCFPDGLPFDAPEAIWYAEQELAAGTYNITVGRNYGSGWVQGQSIQFTLTKAVPAGGQIVIACGENNANNPTAGRTLTTYGEKGSTTVLETTTTSAGTDGTNLGTIGATNEHSTNGQLNAISRVVYGYNRYSQSAERQWLNSDMGTGLWWKPQNPWDRPPSQAANTEGFLCKLPADFVNMLDYNDITVTLNNFDSSNGVSTEIVHDRIFLPSLEEMNIAPMLSGEGEAWDYYKILAQEAGLPGKFQQWLTYPILKTFILNNHASPHDVFLRSCRRYNASYEFYISSSGYVSNNNACYALRGCPACKIKKS